MEQSIDFKNSLTNKSHQLLTSLNYNEQRHGIVVAALLSAVRIEEQFTVHTSKDFHHITYGENLINLCSNSFENHANHDELLKEISRSIHNKHHYHIPPDISKIVNSLRELTPS